MRAVSVTGLGFGDEGKGHTVAYLATQMPDAMVVRYTGGPQAAHNVVTDEGVWHCFSQFGSGMFTPGTRTHLSSQMMVKLPNLEIEAAVLDAKGVPDVWSRLTVSPDCLLVDSYHAVLGQTKELNRTSPYGTVGMGISDAIECPIKLHVRDIGSGDFVQTVRALRAWLIGETHRVALAGLGKLSDLFTTLLIEDVGDYRRFYDKHWQCIVEDSTALRVSGNLIFEGSQGTLLDPQYGFYPYITKGRVTTDMVYSLLESARVAADVTNLGVTRTYATRHGYGPFVTEDPTLKLIEPHNVDSGWQGRFRLGWLDMVTLRYALSVNKIDALVISHADRLADLSPYKICDEYDYRGRRIPVLGNGSCERTRMLFDCTPVYRDTDFATALTELNVATAMYLTGPRTCDVMIGSQ